MLPASGALLCAAFFSRDDFNVPDGGPETPLAGGLPASHFNAGLLDDVLERKGNRFCMRRKAELIVTGLIADENVTDSVWRRACLRGADTERESDLIVEHTSGLSQHSIRHYLRRRLIDRKKS
jgi:hypothetical protein